MKEGDGEEEVETPEDESAEMESEDESMIEDLRKVVFLYEEGKARMVEVETGIL